MPASMNVVVLAGNCTRDVDLKHTGGGMAVCDIGLAVNDKRKNQQGEWVEESTFVDCSCFGRTAEVAAEYLRKGAPCLIQGRLKYEQWQQDGQNRSKLKVIVDRLQLLGGKPQADGQRPARTNGGSNQPNRNDDDQQGGGSYDDDIPFMPVDWRALG